MQQLEDAMRPDTSLVSIMTVNNEIGVTQPVKEIGKSVKHPDSDKCYAVYRPFRKVPWFLNIL